MKVFHLPDLGEGLAEAEIREWYIKPGDMIAAGDLMVAVETDKAIVDIPAPWAGTVEKLFAAVDDVHPVGEPLVGFEGEDTPAGRPGSDQSEGAGGGNADNAEDRARQDRATQDKKPGGGSGKERADSGTVVGQVRSGGGVLDEKAGAVSGRAAGFKATPAVRALARGLDVDLAVVTPSGPDGVITVADVERVARILAEAGPLEPLRGPRRAMARAMTQAHAEVARVTVNEDAQLGDWYPGGDVSMRLIRGMVAACEAEPSLNAWYDAYSLGRRVLKKIDLGMAVDTPEGLFVPVLRDVGNRSDDDLREGLEALKADVLARRIPAEELRGYTIILSNYGVFGGRYADPVVMPPTVAIVGAGRVRDQVVAVDGQPAVRPVMPVSVSFDHRVVTGGEATRFLMRLVAFLGGE